MGSNHATQNQTTKNTHMKIDTSCSGEYFANRAADGLDQHEGYWPALPTLKRIETPVRKLRTLEEIIADNPDNLDDEE